MGIQDWQPYFAVLPVYVDAYDEREIKDGKMRYLKWGWVERQWYTWTDNEVDGSPVTYSYWRYRLCSK